MKKLFYVLGFIALFVSFLSNPSSIQIIKIPILEARMNLATSIGGGSGAAGGGPATFCSDCVGDGYNVCWEVTSTGLDCYDATDGSSTTENDMSFSASGGSMTTSAGYAYFTCTNGNSIDNTLWEIGFKYQSSGTPGSYCFFYDHDSGANAFALVRNATSNTSLKVYFLGNAKDMNSTVTNLFDGIEHTIVVTYSDAADEISLSIDSETPVTNSYTSSNPALSSGTLALGEYNAADAPCYGTYSDFYIK